MLENKDTDATKAHWFSNAIVAVIVVAAMSFTWGVGMIYMDLRAEDNKIKTEVRVMKAEINGKLNSILEYIKNEKKICNEN